MLSEALGCVSWDNDALFCLLVTTSGSLGTRKTGWVMMPSNVTRRRFGKKWFTLLHLPLQALLVTQQGTKRRQQLTQRATKVWLDTITPTVQKGSHWIYEGDNSSEAFATASQLPPGTRPSPQVLLVLGSANLRVSPALANLSQGNFKEDHGKRSWSKAWEFIQLKTLPGQEANSNSCSGFCQRLIRGKASPSRVSVNSLLQSV